MTRKCFPAIFHSNYLFIQGTIRCAVIDLNIAEGELSLKIIGALDIEGTKIVEELLLAWSSKSTNDGEDIVMGDEEVPPEDQLEELRRCVEQFRPRIESTPWAQSLVASL